MKVSREAGRKGQFPVKTTRREGHKREDPTDRARGIRDQGGDENQSYCAIHPPGPTCPEGRGDQSGVCALQNPPTFLAQSDPGHQNPPTNRGRSGKTTRLPTKSRTNKLGPHHAMEPLRQGEPQPRGCRVPPPRPHVQTGVGAGVTLGQGGAVRDGHLGVSLSPGRWLHWWVRFVDKKKIELNV